MQSAAFFEYGKQQHQPVEIHAVRRAPRLIGARRREQRLHFRKDRARALHNAGNARTRRVDGTTGQHDLRRVRDLAQTGVAHFKYADLVRGTEAVFGGA